MKAAKDGLHKGARAADTAKGIGQLNRRQAPAAERRYGSTMIYEPATFRVPGALWFSVRLWSRIVRAPRAMSTES